MRVLVCGGRKNNDYVSLYHALDEIDVERGPITAIIAGGAKGIDTWAESWAWMNRERLEYLKFPALWKIHGSKAAGPIRNKQMIEEGKPDLIVAAKGHAGTANMVKQALAAGIEIIYVTPRRVPILMRPSADT